MTNLISLIAVLFTLPSACALAADDPPPIHKLDLSGAQNLKLSIYAFPVPEARSLALGPDGTVVVGTRDEDVYALLPDKNKDGKADGIKVIAEDLNSPNGVAFRGKDLFIAEIEKISVIRNFDVTAPRKPKLEKWGPTFPDKSHHGWKFIAFGPDGWLYVPVGAPCNVCLEDPSLFAAIHRVSPDGKRRELVAKGVRNTVGLDWHPATKELWFTDNGRDMMGDDIPADELNRVTKMGGHYGFPHCHGGGIADEKFGEGVKCADYIAPALEFPAHAAALGMRFLRHQKDRALQNTALVALHGSWNRSKPIGYQVVKVRFENGKAVGQDVFLTGFLEGEEAWGRPVDVLELPNGDILISDDKAGAVYRLSEK